MTIGDRIKKIRKLAGENQRDFASSIKVSQPALAMFENGQREAKDIHIEQICLKYGINDVWLKTGEGEIYKEPDDEVASIVSDLLEESNPFYDIILGITKAYQKLDTKSQEVLKNLSKELLEKMKEGD